MISERESKIGYVYALFMIILLLIVVLFLLCDLDIVGSGICENFNNIIDSLSDKVNSFVGFK